MSSELKIKKIVSFSSEDKIFKAENLIDNKSKWIGSTDKSTKQSIILQLEEPSEIRQVDIQNELSAFIEILVSDSSMKDADFKVLVASTSFMNPIESKNSTNANRMKTFTDESQISKESLGKKWNYVKICCTQAFNQELQFGISSIKLYSQNVSKNADIDLTKIQTGIFNLKKDVSNSSNTINEIEVTEKKEESIYQKWKNKEENKDSATSNMSKRKKPDTDESDNENKNNETKISSSMASSSTSSPSKKLTRNKSDPEQILKGVIFALSGFQNPLRSEIRDMGIRLGAKYRPDWTNDCTHLVSAFANTTKGNQVKKDGGKIVKKEWIEDCEKKQTLLNWQKYTFNHQKKADSDDSDTDKNGKNITQVLKGVIFALSGFQNPLRSEIRDKGIKLGAKYRPDWTDDCTHLVSAFPNTAKACQVRKLGGKIVKKEWIEDSESKKMLANWTEYQLESEEEDSDSDSDVDSNKPRKAARKAKTKISNLRNKDEFDDSFESEEDVENSDDRDFIADSDEMEDDDQAISSDSDTSDSSSSEKKSKKKSSKKKNVKSSKKSSKKAKKLSKKKSKLSKKKSSSSSSSDSSSSNSGSSSSSESEIDLEAYKKKKEKELLKKRKKKELSKSTKDDTVTPKTITKQENRTETVTKKKGVKYDDESQEDEKKPNAPVTLKKTQSNSSNKTEINSDSDIEAQKTEKIEDNKDWELPSFFNEKNFFIYGDYDQSRRKALSRIIVGFAGNLHQYMSGDIDYVITDKKWNAEFEESKKENNNIVIVNDDWLDACSRRRKLVAYSTFEVTPDD